MRWWRTRARPRRGGAVSAEILVREFTVLTIFPQMFPGPLGFGVVGRAFADERLVLDVRDLRAWADPPHRQVDDETFGGGAGMVLKPEPLFRAVEAIRAETPPRSLHVVLLDPGGRRFDQAAARELAGYERLVLICGRYEGVDERVRRRLVDEELSIGDYVLCGGELAAMVVVEATARLAPGVVGRAESVAEESFEASLLDHPHYTRPAEFAGLEVPEVLRSGHHEQIESWRRQAALDRTRRQRPDLLARAVTEDDARKGENR
ncbi:MAG: tRNA (guanosine(37)-N1)-methyltransferase TrmD [Acidobacteriota bacterium]|nr:MAG: tRNA (guanosine(37)-N1)-methyltransferase TrmD [Acidobacteriota bacterium]